jgi:hypothetical protein
MVGLLRRMSGVFWSLPRRTWHVHFDTDAEELLAGVHVSMVAGPRCRTHSHQREVFCVNCWVGPWLVVGPCIAVTELVLGSV